MKVAGKNVFNEIDIKNIRKIYLSKNFKDKEIINFIQNNKLKYVITDQNIPAALFSPAVRINVNSFPSPQLL